MMRFKKRNTLVPEDYKMSNVMATNSNLHLQPRNSFINQRQMPQAGCSDSGNTFPGLQDNISDAHIGGGWRTDLRGVLGFYPQEGYAIDQNRNGRFDRGRDGVLVFDHGGDGKYNKEDVQDTNDMMKAATGDFDFNTDGRIARFERFRGNSLRNHYQRLDTNSDGSLDAREIAQGGGKVWVDHSKGGGVSKNELYSPYSIPNSSGYDGPSQRLDFVDPFQRTSHTSNNWGHQPTPWDRGENCEWSYPGGGNCGYDGYVDCY